MTEANPLGVHALVWTGSFDPASVRLACAGTAEAGFDLLEVPLLDPAEIDPEVFVPELARAGLRATCSLGLDPASDISATDLSVVEKGADLLRAALDVTVAIGSGYLGGPIYSALTKYTTPPTAEGRANAVGVLRDLAREAAERGVVVGLEVVNRYESNLVNTVADALRLVDDIGSDAVRVHVDTYHANIEEEDLAGAVRAAAAAGRLGYVHVGESHRGALGTGSVAWEPLFDALVDVGYGGPVVFESFSSAVVSPRFAAALGVWRELWDDSAALARHANDFVRAGLAAARGRAADD